MRIRLALTLTFDRHRPQPEPAEAPYIFESQGAMVETYPQDHMVRPTIGFTTEES